LLFLLLMIENWPAALKRAILPFTNAVDARPEKALVLDSACCVNWVSASRGERSRATEIRTQAKSLLLGHAHGQASAISSARRLIIIAAHRWIAPF
jgi:hypothetical protein